MAAYKPSALQSLLDTYYVLPEYMYEALRCTRDDRENMARIVAGHRRNSSKLSMPGNAVDHYFDVLADRLTCVLQACNELTTTCLNGGNHRLICEVPCTQSTMAMRSGGEKISRGGYKAC